MNLNSNSRAFTLTEILVSLTIGVAILGALFVALRPVYERAQAAIVLKRARDYGLLLRDAVNNRAISDPVPLTAPLGRLTAVSGTYLPSLISAGYAAPTIGCSYVRILYGLGLIDSWKEPNYRGLDAVPSWSQYIIWDKTTNTFNADSMPAAERTAFEASGLPTWSRMLCVLSTTGQPSSAAGANYWFGRNSGDLPINSRVVVWRLVNCPQSFAEALAKAANPPDLRPASGDACDYGPVTYPAPTNGVTNVNIYLIHFP